MADRQQTFREDARTSDKTEAASWPGALQGGATAVLSGLLCWFWLLPQLAAENGPRPETGSVASEMAEVSDADLAGALSTVNLPGSTVARLQKGSRDCGARLAWVTLWRPNGEAAQTIRLRSGNYFSPAFAVTETPVRVAIPYPAPYESGHGILTVLGAGENLTVALSPAWHVPVNASAATHAVTWHPVASCAKP